MSEVSAPKPSEDVMGLIERFANLSQDEILELSNSVDLAGLPPWLNKGGGKDKAAKSPKKMSDKELQDAVGDLDAGDTSPQAKILRAELKRRGLTVSKSKGNDGDSDADDKK